ncbi:GyrI-like domain-containing protein, partial [Bacillus paramycoides]|uniref:GyrI-like domain-containing protein n=1 Tax=Bacillus paramycoides TaxID=2026194 RepID=UPI002E222228|nr:GyrI-like domain-containing protein [Bacillus paramycoides]
NTPKRKKNELNSYGTWLPNSNYERKDGPDFEITAVLNSIFPNEMKMKIYIPIEE